MENVNIYIKDQYFFNPFWRAKKDDNFDRVIVFLFSL